MPRKKDALNPTAPVAEETATELVDSDPMAVDSEEEEDDDDEILVDLQAGSEVHSDSESNDDEDCCDFSIPDGVTIYITTDNASNISKAVSESEFIHVKCFAHTINLAVQKALKVEGINKQLSKVRKVVKYFRKSNKGKYALQVSLCK
jgi:hypothetical protein